MPKDLSEAVRYYRLAAEQGHAYGQRNLGLCYQDGLGVPRDAVEGIRWLRKAADRGFVPAQLSLVLTYKDGLGVPKDQQEALKWLRKAAENGDANAQIWLGAEYSIGRHQSRDLYESARWFRRAAEAGHATGQSGYGHRLLSGQGVGKNPIEAIQWFRKAADQGNADGEHCLGVCYADGLGTDRDFDEARKWFQLAARQNFPDAKYRLRLLFFQKHSILKRRDACITTLGCALLIFHALHTPISVNGFAIAAFLGILAASGLAFLAAMAVMERFGMKGLDEKEADAGSERFFSALKKEPWRFLLVPAEDGFFLLPLLYVGISPVSAAVAAFLFAVAHYPVFPWRYCIPKGTAYFFVALFILPHGIWSIVVAHLLVDVGLFVFILLAKVEGKPTWHRLLRVLRTE